MTFKSSVIPGKDQRKLWKILFTPGKRPRDLVPTLVDSSAVWVSFTTCWS